MKICITGANGFVGQALSDSLISNGHTLAKVVRQSVDDSAYSIGDINSKNDWRTALQGCAAVVHLAARVHVLRDSAENPFAAFREVNVNGTLNLARQAAALGVRRFVFLSSIKVNGEATTASHFGSINNVKRDCFCEKDAPSPEGAYAISKLEAEQGLAEIAEQTGLEVVILRPPLVYGPGVGANFLRLMQLVEQEVPLPLGRVENRRSLLYLGNLLDAIRVSLVHPEAAGKLFVLSDGEDVSTPELINKLAAAMGRRARLLPLPVDLIRFGARVIGKKDEISRLLDSLVVDSSRIRKELDWHPPFTLGEGIAQTVKGYLNSLS